MVSTYYKISLKSHRYNSLSVVFLDVHPVFILVNLLNKHITMSENIPPQRRDRDERSSSAEMEIVFTELFLFGGVK